MASGWKCKHRLSLALFVWVLLASSLAYSLDLECFFEDDTICRQMLEDASDDSCNDPLHLSPPSYLPTPAFRFLFRPTPTGSADRFEEAEVVACRSSGVLPVGLRAPPRHH